MRVSLSDWLFYGLMMEGLKISGHSKAVLLMGGRKARDVEAFYFQLSVREEVTNCALVVWSIWRTGASLKRLHRIFAVNKVKRSCAAILPNFLRIAKSRGGC